MKNDDFIFKVSTAAETDMDDIWTPPTTRGQAEVYTRDMGYTATDDLWLIQGIVWTEIDEI